MQSRMVKLTDRSALAGRRGLTFFTNTSASNGYLFYRNHPFGRCSEHS
ncbi:hypothetical protein EC9_20360 [Rosistilla ulvae]|uniref:Uncharacterized protein n=1 Tax=Rosistilla ulvae TaxID=1930277 RepID=A0A517LYZ9_9BACT|nr:hypothetical protein EC9_20360 [Rosistilla ulvae]